MSDRTYHQFRPGVHYEHSVSVAPASGERLEYWEVKFHTRPLKRLMSWDDALEYMRDTPENWVERERSTRTTEPAE